MGLLGKLPLLEVLKIQNWEKIQTINGLNPSFWYYVLTAWACCTPHLACERLVSRRHSPATPPLMGDYWKQSPYLHLHAILLYNASTSRNRCSSACGLQDAHACVWRLVDLQLHQLEGLGPSHKSICTPKWQCTHLQILEKTIFSFVNKLR